MLRQLIATFLLASVVTWSGPTLPAMAEVVPALRISKDNQVPACVSPARLMRLVLSKNPNLERDYFAVAELYKAEGEKLGLRWDYAFFQILYETDWLRSVEGNNLARFGNNKRNGELEVFADLASGVLAHLQHLQMHSGKRVDNPVAQRTREVQDEMVPKAKLISNKRPVTYLDLAKRWAPNSRKYFPAIDKIASNFRKINCKANGKPLGAEPEALVASIGKAAAASGDEPAAEATEETTAVEPAAVDGEAEAAIEVEAEPSVPKIVKADKPKPSVSAAQQKIDDELASLEAKGKVKAIELPDGGGEPTDAVAVKTKAEAVDATTTPKKKVGTANSLKPSLCKVFTASYGGAKSLLIKSDDGKLTTYTALSVHEGKEDAQAKAYIDAYAKNGSAIGSFGSQKDALVKAFELCPSG